MKTGQEYWRRPSFISEDQLMRVVRPYCILVAHLLVILLPACDVGAAHAWHEGRSRHVLHSCADKNALDPMPVTTHSS